LFFPPHLGFVGFIQKAEAAAQKLAAEDSRKAAEDDRQWQQGSKANAKK
jgi:hypothetical protein